MMGSWGLGWVCPRSLGGGRGLGQAQVTVGISPSLTKRSH